MRTKILQIITLSEWGGAQTVLYDLAANLDKKKFLVEVACQPDGLLVKKLKEKKIKVRAISSFRREITPLKDLKAFFTLYCLIKKEKYDIVHCHSTKAGFLGRIAAKLAGVKKIYFTAHGWGFYNDEEFGGFKKLFVFLERIAAKFSTKIVCVSQKSREDATGQRIAPENKFLVIRNGIDFVVKKEGGKTGKKTETRKGEVVIGMTSRLAYPKDPLLFLGAAKEIKKDFPKARFILIGDGPLMKDCQKFVAENHLKNVSLLGEIKPQETRKLMLGFDIFVLVSKFEGLPVTVIEAMFAGLPVVASNVGGIGELVKQGSNGFLIKKSSFDELKEKLIYLIKNPLKRKIMGRRSLFLTKRNFGLAKMVDAYEKLYQGGL